MHGNFMHLFFNMFALYMFGRILESVWGPKKFLIYYFVTGIGAGISQEVITYITLSDYYAAMTEVMHDPAPENFAIFIHEYIPKQFLEPFQDILAEWSMEPYNKYFMRKAILALQEFYEIKRDIPMVGASGAVFGILLAFGLLFPNVELLLLFPPIPIKAKYFVLIYGAIEFFMGIQQNPSDNVAHFAHLGGMLFGFILILIWKKQKNLYE
jgi:membrane associated rhomboid family serine protease